MIGTTIISLVLLTLMFHLMSGYAFFIIRLLHHLMHPHTLCRGSQYGCHRTLQWRKPQQ
jgi:hypothetical protein